MGLTGTATVYIVLEAVMAQGPRSSQNHYQIALTLLLLLLVVSLEYSNLQPSRPSPSHEDL
jgi:hypothetical protein